MENVAVFYLKSGDSLIGELEELEEEPRMYLKNCYRIVAVSYTHLTLPTKA